MPSNVRYKSAPKRLLEGLVIARVFLAYISEAKFGTAPLGSTARTERRTTVTRKFIVKKYRGSIATVCLLLLTATLMVAQSTSTADSSTTVPQMVKFTGALKDHLGHARTGMIGVSFALYKEQYDGTPLWLEPQNVEADSDGNYSVLLGSTKTEGLPADLFSTSEPRWLGVQVEGEAEQPRILFVSVPYALRASDAATIGGLPPSAFMRASAPGSSRQGNSPITSTTGTAEAPGAAVISPKFSGSASGITDFLPIWLSSSTLGNSTIFENAGRVGIGTTAPATTLDVKGPATVEGTAKVTGPAGIGTTPGSFELEVSAPNQLGEQVEGPFAGVGAGLQLQTTGTGGKGWELLATGKTSA